MSVSKPALAAVINASWGLRQCSRGGYGLIDLNGGYTLSRYGIFAYVKNTAGKRYGAIGYLNGAARCEDRPVGLSLAMCGLCPGPVGSTFARDGRCGFLHDGWRGGAFRTD